jgi:hypothetical protein
LVEPKPGTRRVRAKTEAMVLARVNKWVLAMLGLVRPVRGCAPAAARRC